MNESTPTGQHPEKTFQPSDNFVNEMLAKVEVPVAPPTTPATPRATLETSTNTARPLVPNVADFVPAPAAPVIAGPYGSIPVGYNGEDARRDELKAKQRRLITRVAIATIGVVVAAIIVSIGLYLYAATLTATTYKNGNGGTFKLLFYSGHKTNKLYAPNSITANQPTSLASQMALTSLYSKGGKLPVLLSITGGVVTSTATSTYAQNIDCSGYTKAATVHSAFSNANVTICAIKKNNVTILEFVTLQDATHQYVAIFMQPQPDTKTLTKSQAQAYLGRVGLDPYQAAINDITSSIQLAQ